MKIIDFAKKGNMVRFYLGEDDLQEWYGDDWDDRPYEHNAGRVYDEFVCGTFDVAFPFDWYVIEPAMDWNFQRNSPYCKDDFVRRDAPCLVVVPSEELRDEAFVDEDNYTKWAASDRSFKIYFGDSPLKIRKWKYGEELMTVWTA